MADSERKTVGERPSERAAQDSREIGVLPVGHTIAGLYEIEGLLGVGGMGAVYKAREITLRRTVAIKTLAPFLATEPGARALFEREARAAGAIEHPNVVTIHHFGIDGKLPFIVMEYLRGQDLAQLLGAGALGMARATDIILGVCAGVFAAHEANVVHRDVKPQNIFVMSAQGGDLVKVLDFSVSKLASTEASMEASLSGGENIVGTVRYMSPEQARGAPVGPPSDQFSIGVVLYRAVVGQTPHQGEDTVSVLRSIVAADFRPPRELVPALPGAFEAVLMRALRPKPADRFESVHVFGRALLEFASDWGRRQWTNTFSVDSPNVEVSRPLRTLSPIAPMVPERRIGDIHNAKTQILPGARLDPDAASLPPTHTRVPPMAAAAAPRATAAEPDEKPGRGRSFPPAAKVVLGVIALGGVLALAWAVWPRGTTEIAAPTPVQTAPAPFDPAPAAPPVVAPAPPATPPAEPAPPPGKPSNRRRSRTRHSHQDSAPPASDPDVKWHNGVPILR